MDNKNEKNLPIEATEKAITAGKVSKAGVDKAAKKLGDHVKEVALVQEKTQTIDEAKQVVANEVKEKVEEKEI